MAAIGPAPRPCRHRWLLLAASTWFTFAGLWLVVDFVDGLPQAWHLAAQAVGGLAALAVAGFIIYDSWRDARDAKRMLREYTNEVIEARHRAGHEARGTVITVELPPDCPFETREAIFDGIADLTHEAAVGWDPFVSALLAQIPDDSDPPEED